MLKSLPESWSGNEEREFWATRDSTEDIIAGHIKPARAPSLETSGKLIERCAILAEVVRSIAPVYLAETTTFNQRQLLETMIGAAIWYFPQRIDLWSGRISLEALRTYHPRSGVAQPKLTADHEYPRKVAAAELLTMDWANIGDPGGTVLQLYIEKYGRFNYVTPRENKSLVRHQKGAVFQNPLSSYMNAGIRLVSITLEELTNIKLRNDAVLDRLLTAMDK